MTKRTKIGFLFLAIIGAGLIVWGLWPREYHRDPNVWVTEPEFKVTPSDAKPPADYKPPIELPVKNSTHTNIGDGISQVSGTVTNTDSSTRSIMVVVTYYMPDGKPVEGGAASYGDIAAGAAIDYSVRTSRDVAGFERFAVQANAF
jgi:hypothetical protein